MEVAQTLGNEIHAGTNDDGDQLLTFLLANEEYGVDILRVQEIKGWDSVTPIPNTPAYIKGVINLRGTIVPIIDLRLRFHLDSIEYGPTTVVIVLRVEHEGRSRIMGIIVDAVSDVYNVPEEGMIPSPDFGAAVNTEYVSGLMTVDEKMVIGLDIDRLLNADEMSVVDQAAQ